MIKYRRKFVFLYFKKGLKMDFSKLNPFVRNAGIYEAITKNEECIAYDSRIIYVISGDIVAKIADGKKFHVCAGNLLFIPSSTKYSLKGEYFRAAIITFDPTDKYSDIKEKIPPKAPLDFDFSLSHQNESPFDKMFFIEDFESERDAFTEITNIATSKEGEWQAQISAKLKLLLLKAIEITSENALPSRMVEALDSYIRENCSDEISNTEIGAIFGYHPFYVSRVLKEKKGITLHQYIISYRLKLAKTLLENTKRPIADIAIEAGFTDASYFTKTFRQAFGMTPKEWRNKSKEEFI